MAHIFIALPATDIGIFTVFAMLGDGGLCETHGGREHFGEQFVEQRFEFTAKGGEIFYGLLVQFHNGRIVGRGSLLYVEQGRGDRFARALFGHKGCIEKRLEHMIRPVLNSGIEEVFHIAGLLYGFASLVIDNAQGAIFLIHAVDVSTKIDGKG